MFSLDWVSIKAQIMGPAHLINDYVEFGPILDKEVSGQQNVSLYETKMFVLVIDEPFIFSDLILTLWGNST